MSGATYPAGVVKLYGETLSLSTTLASLGMPGIDVKQAIIYNPAVDFRLHVNPAVTEILYYDASNSAGARFETSGATSTLTTDMTNRSATGTGTAMDSATSSDALYICFNEIVGGIRVDMTSSVNGGSASALTAKYWSGSWSNASASDGTSDSTRTLAQDGSITFSTPSNWIAAHLGGSSPDNMSITDTDATGTYGFWMRLTWSVALDSDTEIANIWALNRDTTRGYFRAGVEYPISFDRRRTGAIEAVLAAGTDTMQVTWLKMSGGG